MLPSLGMPELLLIFAVVLLLFGARKLPEVGRGLGRGIQNFREAMRSGANSRDDES